jgi:endonuclease YncB( thermonuclease family)
MRGWLIAALCLLLAACEDEVAAPEHTPPPSERASATRSPWPTDIPPGTIEEADVTSVVDGDTIVVSLLTNGADLTVRYIGIDTPESTREHECYGIEAFNHNKGLVLNKRVGLERDTRETDDFGRLLRYVWLDGELINETLVREGYAESVAYPPDTARQPQLDAAEDAARAAGAGIWGPGPCTPAPTAVPPATVAAGVCDYSGTLEPVIKGNIASDGEKIYHVPGQQGYDETRINEAAGERWFCTEAEALAAGWRKALA